jgi:tRNA pseudouridine55 synthase
VDKPAGVTSHDVVSVARRVAGVRRVGHAGTLDPFATGLLVLLVGRGTRLLPYIDGEPKVYDATVQFGVETDTDDDTGVSVREAGVPASSAVRDAMARLTGRFDQLPPAYSAKKVDGTRAYAAARRGAPVALAPAPVRVDSWTVLGERDGSLDVRIVCSGGTYVRALARDLGRLSGSAAHLSALRRLRSGPFDVADAVTLDRVRDGDLPIQSFRASIPSLPVQSLDDAALRRVLHGNSVAAEIDGSRVALIDMSGDLVGIAERVGESLQPKVVLRDA